MIMKPPGPAGQTCPIRDEDCGKACQTCMFWIAMPMKDGPEFNCAVNWAAIAGPNLSRRLEGVHEAVISQREVQNGFHESIKKLIGS